MGRALEVTAGQVTAPGATLTAWTYGSGMSNQVKFTRNDKPIYMISAWADNQAAGYLRLRSPKLHDNVQNLRFRVSASEVKPLLPLGSMVRLYAQDIITAEQSGSATAGDIESGAYLTYYEDLEGVEARLIKWDDVRKYGKNYMTVENTLSTGTAGGLSGEEAISAEYDLWKANTDYALLGAYVDVECLLVGLRGPDTGNLRVAVPGDELARDVTGQWFALLSDYTGLPTIPVINSANKAATLVDCWQDEVSADPVVTWIFVELDVAVNTLFRR